MSSSDRIYEEYDDDWIDRHLERIDRAGKQHDARLDRLGDRQFRLVDQHLNGTILSAIQRIEVLRRVPFPSAGE